MGIGHLLDRRPGQLSGGQQQRVALGRALVKQPDVLLFDEPLSNLDARLRLTMRAEIKRLQLELGITSIYVTHDQIEAMTMADRIAVMQGGRLQAFCPPHELYNQPSTLFVAEFVGNPPMNFLNVDVGRGEHGAYRVRRNNLDLPAAPDRGAKAAGVGAVIMGIRPEDVHIVGPEAGGGLAGEVYMVEPLGRDDLVDVRFGDVNVRALADPQQRLTIGQQVRLVFDEHKMQFFDPQTERSLLW
jgi:ABC-type sugar transport system ATPase subunit